MLTADGRTAQALRARRAHIVCAVAVLLGGILQALWYRRTLNPDGVAYLDLSDDVLAGHWGALVQAYWSPLYPVLLAVARAMAGRDALHETLIAHGVNLLGLGFAAAAWSFVLVQLARRSAGLVSFGSPLGIAAGYAVFAWAMLWLMSLHFVTPDLWLAGWTFIAAALVLRHDDTALPRHSLALGAVLGAGYLTKSVLLPVAPFFIAGAVLLAPSAQRRRSAIRACAALALVAGPWIAAISMHEGRATFGDNGRFNYGWFVSGDRWLSPDPVRETGQGAAVFPRIYNSPATYAWSNAPGTYAPWRDPSSWHGAMAPPVIAARQAQVLSRSWHLLAFWLAPWGVVLALVLVAGATLASDQRRATLALLVPSFIALTGYAAVFVEGRYVAPSLALLIVGVVSALRIPSAISVRRVALALLLAAVLWAALDIPIPGLLELSFGVLLYLVLVSRGAPARSLATIAGAALVTVGCAHVFTRAAGDAARLTNHQSMVDGALGARTALRTEQFPEGRRIGVIGDGPSCAVWARQIRARIVAEVPASQAAQFWASPDSVRTQIARAMRAHGAQEIIAFENLPGSLPPGWHHVPNSRVARYALDEP